jgi:hypothetical protein
MWFGRWVSMFQSNLAEERAAPCTLLYECLKGLRFCLTNPFIMKMESVGSSDTLLPILQKAAFPVRKETWKFNHYVEIFTATEQKHSMQLQAKNTNCTTLQTTIIIDTIILTILIL